MCRAINSMDIKDDFSFDITKDKITLKSPNNKTEITIDQNNTKLLMQKLWSAIDINKTQSQEKLYYLHLIDASYEYPTKKHISIHKLLSIEIPKETIEAIIDKKDQKLSELIRNHTIQRLRLYQSIIFFSCICFGIFLLCIKYLKSK